MTDHWYLAEITAAIDAPGSADPALLADASVAYAEACHAVNARLGKVAALIDRGLRSEAIELAERAPALLDEVQRLDFPRQSEWVALLGMLNLQTPPRLELEQAAALNAAYAQQAAIQPLLDKHRLLAVGRAPLAARLQLVRQLHRQDASAPCWGEDVENYEKARFSEMSRELSAATKRNDHAAVHAVASSLLSDEWILPPPTELLTRAAETDANLGAERARLELIDLAPQLEAAHTEMDIERMSTLATDWRRLAEEAKVDASDPLQERVGPALDWRDELQRQAAQERQFERAIHDLELCLDAGESASTLERAYASACRYDRELPPVLEQRARNRLEMLEQSRRRRWIVGISAASLSLLILASVATATVWRASYKSEIERHATALSELIAKNELAAAGEHAETIPVSIQSEPEVSALLSQIEQLVDAERSRTAEFARLMDEADAMDVTKPDTSLIGQLSALAKTPEEVQRLRGVQGAIADHVKTVRLEREQEMAAALRVWAEKLGKLDAGLRLGDGLDEATRQALTNDIVAELRAFPGVSSAYQARADALVSKARAILDFERKLIDRRQGLDEAFELIGQPDAYVRSLQRFVKRHPQAPERGTLQQTIDAESLRSVINWNAFWSEQGRDLVSLTPPQAAGLLEEGRKLLPIDDAPQDPLAKDFRRLEPHLEKIAGRGESLAKLRGWLREPLFNVWVVRKESGEVIYCPTAPIKDGPNVKFMRFVDVLKSTEPSSTRSAVWFGLAPHAQFCKQVLKSLDDEPNLNWDQRFARHVIDLLRLVETPAGDAEPPIDQLVALDLLRRLLLVGGEGSAIFAQVTEGLLKRINDAPIDFLAPWYLADDPRGNAARTASTPLIPSVHSFRRTIAVGSAGRDNYRRGPSRTIWIGAIDASSATSWKIRFKQQPETSSGELVIISDDGISFEHVATLDKGQISQLSGRWPRTSQPVFLVESDTGTPSASPQ